MSTLQTLLKEADTRKSSTISAQLLRNCPEAVEYDAAYHYMMELALQPNMIISADMIKELHRLLYLNINAGEAGHYRTVSSAADLPYAQPSPDDIPRLMGHLADQILSSRTTLHPVELAAMAHKRLVDIYPFPHGNHRTARLLMNLILVNSGYCAVSIPSDRQKDYGRILTESRKTNDMEPLSILIAQCVISPTDSLHSMR